jgi:hypothetical protein
MGAGGESLFSDTSPSLDGGSEPAGFEFVASSRAPPSPMAALFSSLLGSGVLSDMFPRSFSPKIRKEFQVIRQLEASKGVFITCG